jgi:hypothetical protein
MEEDEAELDRYMREDIARHPPPSVFVVSDFDRAVKELCNAPSAVVKMICDVLDPPLTSPLVGDDYHATVARMQMHTMIMRVKAIIGEPLRTPVTDTCFEDLDGWIAEQADPNTNEVDLVALIAALLLCSPVHTIERLRLLLRAVRALKSAPYATDVWWMSKMEKVDIGERPISLPRWWAKCRADGATAGDLPMFKCRVGIELDHEFGRFVRGAVAQLTKDDRYVDGESLRELYYGAARQQTVADDSGELNRQRRGAIRALRWLVKDYAEAGTVEIRAAGAILQDVMEKLRATKALVVRVGERDSVLAPLRPYCFLG